MTNPNPTIARRALRVPDGYSISEGVPERGGALAGFLDALRAWFARFARPPDVPDYLREDVGLPPAPDDPYRRLSGFGPPDRLPRLF